MTHFPPTFFLSFFPIVSFSVVFLSIFLSFSFIFLSTFWCHPKTCNRRSLSNLNGRGNGLPPVSYLRPPFVVQVQPSINSNFRCIKAKHYRQYDSTISRIFWVGRRWKEETSLTNLLSIIHFLWSPVIFMDE